MKVPVMLLLTFVVAASAATQDPQNQAAPDGQLVVDVDLVNVLFTVRDRDGQFVRDLKREDVRVFEDNQPQTITNFSSDTELPLTVALLVDTSGSIRDRLKFQQEAAIEFFYSTLQRNKDQAVVISFDSVVELLQDFTDDPELLSNGVRKIRAGGGTALYDAVYLAITEKLAKEGGRRVLILVSDGDDNSSRVSLTEALEIAQRNDVLVYAVSSNSIAYFGSREQIRGDNTLKAFVEETGGKLFTPAKLEELATNFLDIGKELRPQYQLGYRSTNAAADGSFRRIRIEATNRQYRVQARSGYYAPTAVPPPD